MGRGGRAGEWYKSLVGVVVVVVVGGGRGGGVKVDGDKKKSRAPELLTGRPTRILAYLVEDRQYDRQIRRTDSTARLSQRDTLQTPCLVNAVFEDG